MSAGTAPPPPLGDLPHGIDISHPNYAFDSVIWHPTPTTFNDGFNTEANIILRKTNDDVYQTVGNPTTWHRYVSFGYHAYDHCFQFDTQWERMSKNQTDTLKFIWESYCYQTSRDLLISPILERWAQDIAKPYLIHHSYTLDVDTTDPRQARRMYDEPDLMEVDADNENNKNKPAAVDDTWTTVQGKRTPQEALKTPLPETPTRTPPNATNTDPPTPSPITQTPNTHPKNTHVNDGTLRVTVRWKPETYADIKEDEDAWNLAATDTVHYILATAGEATLFPWMNGTTTPNIPSLELTPDNLLQYLAPRVTPIDSMQMYVFSFRLCLSTGPGKWINSNSTKKNLLQHRVEVSLSNSSSDSGDTISVAGYIFYKHPKYTHRVYYLSHLRRQLPSTTPFFDIGYHRKTPTGQDIPHLVVRCGENHVGPLTEILSAYLDGTHTAVFLGRLLLSKMGTVELDAIFQTHADYTTNTRLLQLAPTIQNVDLIRTEYSTSGNIDRNTREWATSLKDTNGKSIQCDADNGGEKRRAQLLVPAEHLEAATIALHLYKDSISTFTQREAEFTTLIQESYPQAIYVPTRVVHDNLAFIQQRSSCAVWEQAPNSVRKDNNPGTTYRPPNSEPQKKTLFPHAASKPKVTPPPSPKAPPNISKTQEDQTEQNATDDTVTTQSQMTKSQTTTQNRFYEMEAAIRRQQNALQRHTAELQQVNERAVTTMEICQATSNNILSLSETTKNQLCEIRQDVDRQATEQRESIARMTAMIEQLTHQRQDNARQRDTNAATRNPDLYDTTSEEDEESDSDSMSTNTPNERHSQGLLQASPRHKKDKRKTREPGLRSVRQNLNPKTPPPDQDPSAQYKIRRTPDDGDT
jgi:hypothetical protein